MFFSIKAENNLRQWQLKFKLHLLLLKYEKKVEYFKAKANHEKDIIRTINREELENVETQKIISLKKYKICLYL